MILQKLQKVKVEKLTKLTNSKYGYNIKTRTANRVAK